MKLNPLLYPVTSLSLESSKSELVEKKGFIQLYTKGKFPVPVA